MMDQMPGMTDINMTYNSNRSVNGLSPSQVLGWTPVNAPRQTIPILPEDNTDYSISMVLKGKGTKKRCRDANDELSSTRRPKVRKTTAREKRNRALISGIQRSRDYNSGSQRLLASGRVSSGLEPITEHDENDLELAGPAVNKEQNSTDDYQDLSLLDSSCYHESDDEYGSLNESEWDELEAMVDDEAALSNLSNAFSAHQINSGSSPSTIVTPEAATTHAKPDIMIYEDDFVDDDEALYEMLEDDAIDVDKENIPSDGMEEMKDTSIKCAAPDTVSTVTKPFRTPFARLPIVRLPPPPQVPHRSPVLGISSNTILRTCFRIGEAINFGIEALQSNQETVIELYARVASSHREPVPSLKQHFEFKDLYHDRPPYLTGYYSLWKDSELWENESNVFLNDGQAEAKMARCMGKVVRLHGQVTLLVLNIWEASWEDVEYVKGIVNQARD